MKIRIAGVVEDSVVDGEGYRLTIFVQGCPHRCNGCQNPATWDYDGGYDIDTDEIIKKIRENPILAGVTFSGGEPFERVAPLAALAREVHALGLNVWTYTGYTFEEITQKDDARKLLDETDVLVDGPFMMEERDLTLMFRGSRNQRVIDMKKTRETGSLKLLYENTTHDEI